MQVTPKVRSELERLLQTWNKVGIYVTNIPEIYTEIERFKASTQYTDHSASDPYSSLGTKRFRQETGDLHATQYGHTMHYPGATSSSAHMSSEIIGGGLHAGDPNAYLHGGMTAEMMGGSGYEMVTSSLPGYGAHTQPHAMTGDHLHGASGYSQTSGISVSSYASSTVLGVSSTASKSGLGGSTASNILSRLKGVSNTLSKEKSIFSTTIPQSTGPTPFQFFMLKSFFELLKSNTRSETIAQLYPPFLCEICAQRFTGKDLLQAHIDEHKEIERMQLRRKKTALPSRNWMLPLETWIVTDLGKYDYVYRPDQDMLDEMQDVATGKKGQSGAFGQLDDNSANGAEVFLPIDQARKCTRSDPSSDSFNCSLCGEAFKKVFKHELEQVVLVSAIISSKNTLCHPSCAHEVGIA